VKRGSKDNKCNIASYRSSIDTYIVEGGVSLGGAPGKHGEPLGEAEKWF